MKFLSATVFGAAMVLATSAMAQTPAATSASDMQAVQQDFNDHASALGLVGTSWARMQKDTLALLQAKDAEIAALTKQVADLKKQVADLKPAQAKKPIPLPPGPSAAALLSRLP